MDIDFLSRDESIKRNVIICGYYTIVATKVSGYIVY